jgi:hypothetical protein
MFRYHSEFAFIRRHHREHLRVAHGWPRLPVTCVCDLQAGRFRKRDAYDCGRPRCGVCHHEKWPRQQTRAEKLAELRLVEQVAHLALTI